MATDPYAGFELVDAPATDEYAGFEVVQEGPSAQDLRDQAEERRDRDLQRQSGGDIGELGYIEDTANRTGKAALRGVGSIRTGIAKAASMVFEPIFRTIGGEEMVQAQRQNARAIQAQARPSGTANLTPEQASRRAIASIATDPRRDDTTTAAVAEFAGTALPTLATGPIAPLTGGLQMGGSSVESSRELGLSPEEENRRFLINAGGGTALGFIPIPGVRRVGGMLDDATLQLQNRALQETVRRGGRAAVGGASGALVNTAGDVALQLAENETLDLSSLDLDRLKANAAVGFGSGAGVGLASRPGARTVPPPPVEAPVTAPVVDAPPPMTPARRSALAFEDALAREENLRQSPEGLSLLQQQLRDEATLALTPEAQLELGPRSPARESAEVFQRAARNEEILGEVRAAEDALELDTARNAEAAARRSPEGAENLRRQLQSEEEAAALRAVDEANAEIDQFEADAAAARRADDGLSVQAARALDEFEEGAPTVERRRRPMRMSDESGFVDTALVLDPRVRAIGGALGGGAYGITQGDTPEERARNALLYAAGGGALALSPEVVRLAGRGGAQRKKPFPENAQVMVQEYVGADGQPKKAIQIDLIDPVSRDSNRSVSPEQLAAEGFDVPDLNQLPQGIHSAESISGAPFGAEPEIPPQQDITYVGRQQLPAGAAERGITGESFKISQAIPGHPAGSNVSRATLEAAGYNIPETPDFIAGTRDPVSMRAVLAGTDVASGGNAGAPPGGGGGGGATPPPGGSGPTGSPGGGPNINFPLPEKPGFLQDLKRDLKTVWAGATRGLDKALGSSATRLKNIAPEVYGELQRYEFNVRQIAQNLKKEIVPFLDQANALLTAPDDKRRLTVFLDNGDFEGAVALMSDRAVQQANTEIQTALRAAPSLTPQAQQQLRQGILASWGQKLNGTLEAFANANAANADMLQTARAAGIESGEVQNYWHRQIDPRYKEEFLNKIGREENGPIWEAVVEKAKQQGIDPSQMSIEERADITNQVLRGVRPSADGGLPSQFKGRGIQNIADLENYYLPFDKSAISYVDSTVRAVERRRLFGRIEDGIGGSVGLAVERAREMGLTPQQETDLKEILLARFGPGERGSGRAFRLARDATNVAYLGQFRDTITQLADFALSPARFGFRDTLSALRDGVAGTPEINVKDIGLDQVAQEYTNAGKTSKAVDTVLTLTGFKKVVEAAQNNTLNSALKFLRRQASTPEGVQMLAAKYGRSMGPEFAPMIRDLQSGAVSDNVKLAAFTELTDSQPITLTEMPQLYLEHPNGRLLYAMKTFPLKQLDLFRRDAIGNILAGRESIRAGNSALGHKQIKTGILNLGKLAAAYTMGGAITNAIKDTIADREIDPEDYALTGLLGLVGFNRFDIYNLQRNGPGRTLIDKIAPAYTLVDELYEAAGGDPERLKQRFPFIGDLWFEYGEGGEKRAEADRKRKAAQERKNDPAAQRKKERDQRRKERREESGR